VVLRVRAWISHWNCVCSLAHLFIDVPKTTSTIEQFAHGSKFLWIIAAQLCSAPHPLPDPLLQFWGIGHQVTNAFFFWKLPWEANTSTISNLNQWSVFHWCSTILLAPYKLWKHILCADDSLENKEHNLRSFGPCTNTISIDSSRPFEVDSGKKLWILDLLPWFLRWTAFGQANLECRCWNKRKDSTCWIIFRWDYCFKTCNFFLFCPRKT